MEEFTRRERMFTQRVNELLSNSGVTLRISLSRGRELIRQGRTVYGAANAALEHERNVWRKRGYHI